MRLLVRWEEPSRAREALRETPPLLRELGGRVMWASDIVPGIGIIEVPEGLEEASLSLLRETREFRYAGRDCWAAPTSLPTDPRWVDGSQPPTLDRLCVQSLWSYRTATTEPVAIVDSGVAFFEDQPGDPLLPHKDLRANILVNAADPIDGIDNDGNNYVDDYWGSEFLPPNPNGSTFPLPRDRHGHGTEMSSVAGAFGDNGLEMTGVAWSIPLIIVKYSDNLGNSSASSILQSLESAHKRFARIINCSWQIYTKDPTGVVAVYDFIANTPATLYVQSAGNSGIDLDATNCFSYFPSQWSLPNMLVVGGTNTDDSPWGLDYFAGPCDWRGEDNTNYGATLVDVMAPAEPVWGLSVADPNGPASPGGGTSQAAAMVSAVASFVWSEFPTFTNLEVKQRIMNKVDIIPGLSGWCVTGGRVNAARAVGADCE